MKMIHKHEGGQTMTSIARELGLAPSTISSIVKEAARIREHAEGTATMKATIITKKRGGAISDGEIVVNLDGRPGSKACSPKHAVSSRPKAFLKTSRPSIRTALKPFRPAGVGFGVSGIVQGFTT